MGSIGQAIKSLRRRKGFSQQKVQDLSEGLVKAAWIASLETDRLELLSQKQVEKLQRIAEILGASVLDIFSDAGLIDLPYPPETSSEEQEILDDFRRLSPELRQAALNLVHDLRVAYQSEPTAGAVVSLAVRHASLVPGNSGANRALEVVKRQESHEQKDKGNNSS